MKFNYRSTNGKPLGTRTLVAALMLMVLIQVSVAVEFPEAIEVRVDHSWPQLPLPNNWTLGQVGGIAVDADDNVWIVQRPGTLYQYEKAAAESPPIALCCVPAPAVIQFAPSGKILRAWGGPGNGYDWPATEHGIELDPAGNVWIGGSRTQRGSDQEDPSAIDGMVLKFTQDGEFLMQIGQAGPSQGSLSEEQLAGAADIAFNAESNEVFIADGYGNHRVAVFDMESGEFKRMWGAYGRQPTDRDIPPYAAEAEPATQFRNVHCITVADDGLVYVCDRDNNRMQIFRQDGGFVDEWFFRPATDASRGPGTVAHAALWPDASQSVLLVTDIPNSLVVFTRRSDGKELGSFGTFGNYGGQLNRLHQAVVDSQGNIYTAEAAGKRVQKFVVAGGGSGRID